MTAQQVQAWARGARDSALVGVPDMPRTPLPDLVDRSGWEWPSRSPVGSEVFKRRLTAVAPPRDLKVNIGDEGMSMTAGGTTIGGCWDEVVGVGRAPGFRFLHFADGSEGPIWAKHVKDGDRLISLIDERSGDVSWETSVDAVFEDQ